MVCYNLLVKKRKEIKKMDLALIVLAVLYLCGLKVGTALAICAIIEAILITVTNILRKRKES